MIEGPTSDQTLGFERLVGDLSARFAGLLSGEIDDVLLESLAALGEFFAADRIQLSEITRDSEVRVTHSWSRPGIEAVPVGTMWAAMIPGALQVVLGGEIFSFSHIDELTDERFAVDRQTFLEVGTQAHLSIPVEVGGEILGVLTVGVLAGPRDWPDAQLDRLRLMAQVFGNALTRRVAERELQTSLAEVQNLKQRLLAESRYLEKEIEETGRFEEIIGESGVMRAIFHQVEQVAPTDATILILGETGTGKELVARTVHRISARAHHPLVKVNCATLPATLIESELFGHERGAFTGAVKRKIGRFEVADEGTIFLDEIGDLPLELQAKLLRVLQDGEFERLGSTDTRTVDVRVIAATNRDLLAAVEDGSFRADLYYRLRVVPIEMPPLRNRRDDIPLLAWHFVRHHQTAMNKTIRRIPNEVSKAMQSYEWPGNVRELANIIERAVIFTKGETLVVDEAFVRKQTPSPTEAGSDDLQAVERSHIIGTLEKCGWKVKGNGNAAERLGLNPSTLRARMKKLGIKRPDG
jgi:transcriptional regulator with GAF, ATPase, and Fis domain